MVVSFQTHFCKKHTFIFYMTFFSISSHHPAGYNLSPFGGSPFTIFQACATALGSYMVPGMCTSGSLLVHITCCKDVYSGQAALGWFSAMFGTWESLPSYMLHDHFPLRSCLLAVQLSSSAQAPLTLRTPAFPCLSSSSLTNFFLIAGKSCFHVSGQDILTMPSNPLPDLLLPLLN